MKVKNIIIGVLVVTNLFTLLMLFRSPDRLSKTEVEEYYKNISDIYDECHSVSDQLPLSSENTQLVDQSIANLDSFEQSFLVTVYDRFEHFKDAVSEEFFFLSRYKEEVTSYCQLLKEVDSKEGVIQDYEFDILQTDKSLISIINGLD